MKNIHPEFAYQSRELAIQIEDTLGDPPDRKNYDQVVKTLIAEYAKGAGLEDVNFLSFALADYLQFNNPAGLLAQSSQYDDGDADSVFAMVSCADAQAKKALTTAFENDPELTRKAIVTAFLFKNHNRWSEEDHSLESLQRDENNEEESEDESEQLTPGHDIAHLFDERGDENA